MDILYISVCLIGFFICPSFGQGNYEVNFRNSTQVDVSEGAELVTFTCDVTGDSLDVFSNQVEFWFVNPVSGDEKRMSKNAALEGGEPEFYAAKNVKSTEIDKKFSMKFTILKVRYQDDGKFECRYIDKKDSVEVVVHRPLATLSLKFANEAPISETATDPITIDAGKYTVECIAEGSNPGTKDVHLFFNGVMVEHGEPVVAQMEAAERKYRTTLSADVDIMVQDANKEFDCQAKDSEGNAFSTKLSIAVNIYEPEVVCNDTEAFQGEANPIISCTVNHTDMEVAGYSYQIGESGEIIKEGDSHEKNIKVTVSNVAPGMSIVAMDLHKARAEYLDKDYYLLIDMKGGHTFKESVRLHSVQAPEIDDGGNGDGGNSVGRISSSVFLSMLMCVVLCWWL